MKLLKNVVDMAAESVIVPPVARRNANTNRIPPTNQMKTTVILFRNEQGNWTLSSYNGDTIPSIDFTTATAARAYAKSKGWNVRRATNCDA